jgi:chromosome segregation ATPase
MTDTITPSFEDAANRWHAAYVEVLAERDALRKQAIAMEAEIASLTDERAGIRADRDSFRAERDRLSVEWGRAQEQVKMLRASLSAMLTHMGMDEDEWNKPTYDQARAALAATKEKP